MRWSWRRFFLLLVYGVFFATAGIFASDSIRYSGVDRWPSVEATDIEQTGTVYQVAAPSRYHDFRTFDLDKRELRFAYTVNGHSYHGDRFSPDKRGAPDGWREFPWRAYYDPSAPDVAVLNPVPYQGTAWLLAATVSGFLAAGHFYFAFVRRAKRIE